MTTTLDLSSWMSVGRAARNLDVSDSTLRGWAASGKLRAVRTELGWLIDGADVERLRKEREARKGRGKHAA